jgi:hypothetical protein
VGRPIREKDALTELRPEVNGAVCTVNRHIPLASLLLLLLQEQQEEQEEKEEQPM